MMNSTCLKSSGYKTAARTDIQYEIAVLSFDDISKAAPGEPSAAISERVFAEAIGYRNLDRGDWAERGI